MFSNTNTFFHPLIVDSDFSLPEAFTFPFYYKPHSLTIKAAEDLQAYLEKQKDFNHNFGLDENAKSLAIGKMFGVMVVQNAMGELGYLAAFSGKLAESNAINGFVPPIYDNLNSEGFYKKGEAYLNKLNKKIESLEADERIKKAKKDLHRLEEKYHNDLKEFKEQSRIAKLERRAKREKAKAELPNDTYNDLDEQLSKESIYFHFRLKDLKKEGEAAIKKARLKCETFDKPIKVLKEERRQLSNSLQKRLHECYIFLNAKGEAKNLLDIFKGTNTLQPPAGSGECAAPKLFQYAYENNLKPIAMAEFWWGISPKSQVRKHKQFYPSCRSKCEPILGHMMQGLQVEENPITKAINFNQKLEIIYEDDYLLLVNKPHEFLSVPGIHIEDSVLARMRAYLPDATGSLLLHRLDMSTSGLLLVAKNAKTFKKLQKQFIERKVKKRYVALLEGKLPKSTGEINLPLRVDLDNRPQQLVCFEHGKPAKTQYKVISIEGNKTRIHFYPITGRTHQLRVHAAHAEGLGLPIVGDDLYGNKADRLYLHAESLTFEHPVDKKWVEFTSKVPY